MATKARKHARVTRPAAVRALDRARGGVAHGNGKRAPRRCAVDRHQLVRMTASTVCQPSSARSSESSAADSDSGVPPRARATRSNARRELREGVRKKTRPVKPELVNPFNFFQPLTFSPAGRMPSNQPPKEIFMRNLFYLFLLRFFPSLNTHLSIPRRNTHLNQPLPFDAACTSLSCISHVCAFVVYLGLNEADHHTHSLLLFRTCDTRCSRWRSNARVRRGLAALFERVSEKNCRNHVSSCNCMRDRCTPGERTRHQGGAQGILGIR